MKNFTISSTIGSQQKTNRISIHKTELRWKSDLCLLLDYQIVNSNLILLLRDIKRHNFTDNRRHLNLFRKGNLHQ